MFEVDATAVKVAGERPDQHRLVASLDDLAGSGREGVLGFDVGAPGPDAIDPAVLVALVTDHGVVCEEGE